MKVVNTGHYSVLDHSDWEVIRLESKRLIEKYGGHWEDAWDAEELKQVFIEMMKQTIQPQIGD